MSEERTPRASELAASKVEEIVTAAGEAAAQIRESAELDGRQIRADAEAQAERAREEAKRAAEAELNEARKATILYGQDARREAEALVGAAKEEADQIREQTQRAVDGRVAAAEKAAAEVLEEARALSGGLRQLGRSLEEHADRILRDVTAAHKQMQADLRVGGVGEPAAGTRSGFISEAPGEHSTSGEERAGRTEARSGRAEDLRPRDRTDRRPVSGRSRRANPFEDLDIPSWER